MSYSKTNNIVNTPKNKNVTFSFSVIIIIILSFLILVDTATVIPILGFHGVLDIKNPMTKVERSRLHYPKQDLEKFLEYLIINDYWFLTAQDLYNLLSRQTEHNSKSLLKKKPILISFDDGYRTVHTNLLPILRRLEKKHGKKVKVVLFINPGNFSKKASINSEKLGCQELREGFQEGFYDIQSHGLNHKNLTLLSNRKLINEILSSQTELRRCTQDLDPEKRVASHFAYPYGAYNKRVQRYVSKYYLSSYLYNNQILNKRYLHNYYEIPRLTVNRQESLKNLIDKFEKKTNHESLRILEDK